MVSLERGVCSCAELQVISYYRGWKEACQATRAISTTWRRDRSSSFYFLQGKAPKEIHAILTETLGERAPLHATVKNWVVLFKRGDFSTCDAPRPGRPKTVTTPEITDQNHELILEDRRISAKSIAEHSHWLSPIISTNGKLKKKTLDKILYVIEESDMSQ